MAGLVPATHDHLIDPVIMGPRHSASLQPGMTI